MSDSFTIAVLLPSILDTNGDAANARVLATRAEWAGIDGARVVAMEAGDPFPQQLDAIVIGSGTDATLEEARDALLPLADDIRRLVTDGVPLLAVGTGWELLSWGIELGTDARIVEGLGIVAGRALPRTGRASDDLAITFKGSRLVGYENHARDYVGAEASPLGRIAYGSGNGRDAGQEGVIMGDVYCTHMHGPVLAKNPVLADRILAAAMRRRGEQFSAPSNAEALFADTMAKAARNQIATRLGLDEET